MIRGGCPHVAIVRRGQTEVFRALTERIADLQLADVIWDRRAAERRTGLGGGSSTDRRRQERRQAPHGTWVPLGFVFAHAGGGSPSGA